MTFYQIDDKVYYINLQNLFSVVSETPTNEKIVNTTITQFYGDSDSEIVGNGKEIVEAKSNMNETMNNVRYDFIKLIFSCLFDNNYTMEGIPTKPVHLKDLSLSQRLCINTLIEYKILMEIETNE